MVRTRSQRMTPASDQSELNDCKSSVEEPLPRKQAKSAASRKEAQTSQSRRKAKACCVRGGSARKKTRRSVPAGLMRLAADLRHLAARLLEMADHAERGDYNRDSGFESEVDNDGMDGVSTLLQETMTRLGGVEQQHGSSTGEDGVVVEPEYDH